MSQIKVLWASAHQPTAEQLRELEDSTLYKVVYLKELYPELFNKLVEQEFDSNLDEIAIRLFTFCEHLGIPIICQPGGSPAFQFTLGQLSTKHDIHIWYAFSKRISVDTPNPDGSVKKVSTFVHEGFIECNWVTLSIIKVLLLQRVNSRIYRDYTHAPGVAVSDDTAQNKSVTLA